MHTRIRNRNVQGRFVLVVMATLAVFGLALPAAAQDGEVYLTYTAEDLGPLSGSVAGIVPGAIVPLHLWVQGGGSASSAGPCQLGATGNEICAVNVTLEGNGHFTFSDFTPTAAFDSGPSAVPVLANVTASTLVLNALDFGTPGLANRYLGLVYVTAVGDPTPEDAMTVRGGVMRSNMEMWPIVERDVAVPEPAFGLGVGLGALLLAGGRRGR